MFVGSFEGNFSQFPLDVDAAVRQFKASGVTNLLIDVTNNGGTFASRDQILESLTLAAQGGFVCLGMFLYQYLSGTSAGSSYVHRIRNTSSPLIMFFRTYESTSRANPLAQKMVEANIALGLDSSTSFYASDNCKLSRLGHPSHEV